MSEPTQNQLSWPFREAERIAERLKQTGKTSALFETGYGPSGLPHIGTFGEVARTSWVRNAFTALTGLPSRLIAFSDDMDGLRKVPDNVPNKEMLKEFLGRPLTKVPDPFGTHESFGAHNNARLQVVLDSFGFAYEFASPGDVPVRKVRRRAAACAGQACRDRRDHPPDARAGAPRHLFADFADPSADRHRHLEVPIGQVDVADGNLAGWTLIRASGSRRR